MVKASDSLFTAREARAAIERERETRHWTINQRAQALGENWPSETARITREADAAVDWFVAALDQLRSAWNTHFRDCPQPAPGMPTTEELIAWRANLAGCLTDVAAELQGGAVPHRADELMRVAARVIANEGNHYDRYWQPPKGPVTDEWLDSTEAKMREALTDVYCDDAAAVMLTLLAEIRRNRAALSEALDLLEATSAGETHDGKQEWQDAFARIHDAAGRPQRVDLPKPTAEDIASWMSAPSDTASA